MCINTHVYFYVHTIIERYSRKVSRVFTSGVVCLIFFWQRENFTFHFKRPFFKLCLYVLLFLREIILMVKKNAEEIKKYKDTPE